MPGNVRVTLGESELRACHSCGTWVYFPRPAAAQQAAIHDTADYFEHPYFELRRRAGDAQIRRCKQIMLRLTEAVGVSLRGERVLDVGCDTGLFLSIAAREFGIRPVGVDVGARAVAVAAEQGIEAYHTPIETAPEHLRDLRAMTAIDLVEHVSDPAAFLRELRKRLAPGGVIYLETPNIRSAVYKIGRILSKFMGGRPAALYERLFPPQHIQYFTRESFQALATSCELEVTQIGTRMLPSADTAASAPVRAAMAGMQGIDALTGERILLWATLRRPS